METAKCVLLRPDQDDDDDDDNDNDNRCVRQDSDDDDDDNDDDDDDEGPFGEGPRFDEGFVEGVLSELKQCLPKCSTTRDCGPGFVCSNEGVCRKVLTQHQAHKKSVNNSIMAVCKKNPT